MPRSPTLTISLDRALAQEQPALEQLMQLYCYDWSEQMPLDPRDDGRFAGVDLAPYWVDDWRHPFLLRVDGSLGGFALILGRSRLTGAEGTFDMAEFFVLRRHRRRGVGLAAARAAFDHFRGPWELRQRDENAAATTFWRRAIGDYTGGCFREERHETPEWKGLVQRFSTAERARPAT
jgi:predicted acetyltransferase